MRILFLFLFVCSSSTILAQKGDYPDYRSKKESFLKIPDKGIRADLASFTITGIEESIGKPSLNKILITGFGPDYMNFEGDNTEGKHVKVKVRTTAFDAAGLKLQKVEDHVVKINGKPFYGKYGHLPTTRIHELVVMVDKDTITIPPVAYADLYDLNFGYRDALGTLRSTNGIFLSADKNKMYIYLLNKAADDTYEVTWIIQDKKYLRRVLDFGF